MTYWIGVDLGTTYTAAATHSSDRSEIFDLGTRTSTIPSVVYVRDDGTFLTGAAASRRALQDPSRVAREFKRRVGDPTPILLAGSPYPAEALSAKLLRSVIDAITTRQGSAPEGVVLTHPANWGPYKLDLLAQALRVAEIGDVELLTEPEAAAIQYASLERVEPGSVIAVFDLGGGTFDAAVLRKDDEQGFQFLGRPEGIERLGGADFDEAVFGFVSRWAGDAIQALDPNDSTALAAVARLRSECVEAKEALSFDTKVTIPVVLPNVHTEVTLTRSEFENLIRPSLDNAIETMRRVVKGAGIELSDVDLVLLVGGSSRIPLIGQMVAGGLGRPVAIDAHPKHLVALGAALAASTPDPPAVEVVVAAPPTMTQPVPPVRVEPVVEPRPKSVVDTTEEDRPKRGLLIAGAVALALVVALGALFLRPDDGDSAEAALSAPSTVAGADGTDDSSDTPLQPDATEGSVEPEMAVSTTEDDQAEVPETPATSTTNDTLADNTTTAAPTTAAVMTAVSTTTARPTTTASATTTTSTPTTTPEPTTTTSTTTTSTTTTTTTTATTTPRTTFVPSVSGLTGAAAVTSIRNQGLNASCGDRCADIVAGTSPGAVTELEPGTTITLIFG
ncbi:MAG: Hsp70 family protein [Actinomycetia bacterium]|nr:Hsp70 family protein [Actinomycetes bacterium]